MLAMTAYQSSPLKLSCESPLFFPIDRLFDMGQSQNLLNNQHMFHVPLNRNLQAHFVPNKLLELIKKTMRNRIEKIRVVIKRR